MNPLIILSTICTNCVETYYCNKLAIIGISLGVLVFLLIAINEIIDAYYKINSKSNKNK
jgi:hypothetical protein